VQTFLRKKQNKKLLFLKTYKINLYIQVLAQQQQQQSSASHSALNRPVVNQALNHHQSAAAFSVSPSTAERLMANRGAVKKLCIKRRDEQKQLVFSKINYL